MPVYQLNDSLWFPPSTEYEEHGVVAIGGDVGFERLLEAYKQGVFPWYNSNEPITWVCPDKRMILPPAQVRISKSSRNILNRKKFTVKADTCFEEVINHCQQIKRDGQNGTWLNDELKNSIIELHHLGYAHSVECFENDVLVGGLYGLGIGKIFCGDSMFSLVSNASKIAFIKMCKVLHHKNFQYIDCQVYNKHLASLGAYEMNRENYLEKVAINQSQITLKGSWTNWFE